MTHIRVSGLQEFLEAGLSADDTVEFAGDRWSLNCLLSDLYNLPLEYPFPPALELLRRAELARAAVQFDWLTATCGTDEEGLPLLAEAIRREIGPQARSVFLPVVIDLLAYTAAPELIDQSAIERLHAHLMCAWPMMEHQPRLQFALSLVAIRGCRLYTVAGDTDAGLKLLCSIRALVANQLLSERRDDLHLHATCAALARTICNLIWEHLESCQLLTLIERAAAIKNEAEIGPAGALRELEAEMRVWREAGERQTWPDRTGEDFRRADLACRYLRFVFELARAQAEGEWPRFPHEDFERLADDYRTVGLKEAHILSSEVGHIAFRLRHRPQDLLEFKGTIEQLAKRLDEAMSQVPPHHPDFHDSATRLVECYALLCDYGRCRQWVAVAIKNLALVLPKITDPVTRSFFLRSANDWLGYAHLCSVDELDNSERFFNQAYQELRGTPWSKPDRSLRAALLQVCVSHPNIVIRASYGDKANEIGMRGTLECFTDLQSISQQARHDLLHFEKTKQAPDSGLRWNELADRLRGQLGVNNLLSEVSLRSPAGCPVLVETYGNGLHMPWCGLLAESSLRPSAVLVSDLDIAPQSAAAAADEQDGILALNCFKVGDPLDGMFMELAVAVGAKVVRCSARATFCEALQAAPARLILTGGHGIQGGILNELQLQFGAEQEDALKVWQGVRLLRASIVVGFTCFGGGGVTQATGEFGSVASLALRAGARAAVASSWPAWMLPATFDLYRDLLLGLADSTLNSDPWRLAEDVMRFVNSMHVAGAWNALGWGVYVGSDHQAL